MRLSDFDYALPAERIAQEPVLDRTQARLMVLDRATGRIEHRRFKDLAEYLRPGDCLVLNDTRVIKARFFGRKKTGGKVEILLLKDQGQHEWEVLLRPGGRLKQGAEIVLDENGVELRALVLEGPRQDSGLRRIRFFGTDDIDRALDALGRVPLPPYIDRPDTEIDRELYQTVFAARRGAVASPTAGLHFDRALLDDLGARGVEQVFITLHVGYGTFQPVALEEIERHRMHPEEYFISPESSEAVSRALSEGRRIVACGTTVVRTLEATVRPDAKGSPMIPAESGLASLFIHPPFEFRTVGAMITNFHLPRTTLLMLVSAFAGTDRIRAAYQEAISEGYRFYSYGDAMLIL
ncbi:MAG: tRNA preQ1(34) S-adenosylmethionine ribosyltransferase-isomerase QueA [Candidatus Omnitrophica bacterium]|nr:tRNA preQ1(34) S-adenosylmethionine ribosyltransferase-isomerase QueA [Candidatus Omnitrophota bacterium]